MSIQSVERPQTAPLHRLTLAARGHDLELASPVNPVELREAATAVSRVLTEFASRWELVPGTEGSSAQRATLLDTAAEALDGLGIMHYALDCLGDVLCSGSPRPRRSPGPFAGPSPFFGEPFAARVLDAQGRALADVGLAGTPGSVGALVTRRRGSGEGHRQVAVLGPDATTAEAAAQTLLAAGRRFDKTLADAVAERDCAALVLTATGETLTTSGWPAAGAPWWAPRSR